MKRGRLIFITRNYKSIGHGGGKARVDVEDILTRKGAINVGLNRTFYRNKILDFFLTLTGVLMFMITSRRGDTLFLQYPMKKYYRLMCRVAKRKGIKTITLIHDLGSFRRRKLTVDEEIEKLSHTDVIIAANTNMMEWLAAHGCRVPMTDHKAWDYISLCEPRQKPTLSNSCIYVGDLNPAHNGYLYKMPPSLKIHVYGNRCPAEIPENVVNHGFTEADEIIVAGEGRYGLLWYGTDLVHNDNEFIGEYIRYCNPHKLSLYMRAGKPVIIWEHAAEADFVRENRVGITVSSLEDIEQTLADISDEYYEEMLHNVAVVSELMSKGRYLCSALWHAAELL